MASRTLAWLALFALLMALALRLQNPAADLDTISREQVAYQRLRGIILERYVRDLDEKDRKRMFYGAMDGMANGLDQHSRFLPPELFEGLKTTTTGLFEGVGIEINPDESLGLVVLTPLQGTPAFKGGVLPGDKILRIDGVAVEGLSRDECSRRIRGPVGTSVRLHILHDGERNPVDITLTRAVNELKSVQAAELLPTAEPGAPKIGYVQVSQFQLKTGEDLNAALTRLEQDGMQALVLDLRQNPGGLLDAAEQVADLFLKDGEIVSVISREAENAKDGGRVTYAKAEGTHPDYPLAILMDGQSASASEVVAGALKDRGRAVLVGDKTYGKFSVQDIFRVPMGNWGESALKLTIARYKTPRSLCKDGEGLAPDHPVPFALEQQRGLLQSRLQRHLRDNDPRTQSHAREQAVTQNDAEKFDDLQLKKAVEVLTLQLQAAKSAVR